MPFEVINYLTATPNRVYAMLQLIKTLEEDSPTQEMVFSLLQPDSVQEKQESARAVYSTLQNLNMISVTQSDPEIVRVVEDRFPASFEAFRLKMQQILLGATKPEDDNFLFSQMTAIYAVLNQDAILRRRGDFERLFHENLYPSIVKNNDTRKINDSSLLAWGLWARFLGFGREYSAAGGQRKLLPNAYVRIRPLIDQILPEGSELSISQFIEKLSLNCPELDGGIVYNSVYESVHGHSAAHAPFMSLMLSSALRTLQVDGTIDLIDRADATNTRQLFPSQSYQGRVSHIRVRQENKSA